MDDHRLVIRPVALVAAALGLTICVAGCSASDPTQVSTGPARVIAGAPASTPRPSVRQPADCSPARTTDSSGAVIPTSYATVVQQIHDAACEHDYAALTALMDSQFTDDTHSSASPGVIIAGWKSRYPTGKNLDRLAATLAQTPVVDQGGVTYSDHGATLTLARRYQAQPWSGFTYQGASASGARNPAGGSPGQTSGSEAQELTEGAATCPGSATLVSAWNAGPGQPGKMAAGVSGIRCSGRWAAGQVHVDDGSAYGNSYSGLFQRREGDWLSVDRDQPCATGQVPPSLQIVCDSN